MFNVVLKYGARSEVNYFTPLMHWRWSKLCDTIYIRFRIHFFLTASTDVRLRGCPMRKIFCVTEKNPRLSSSLFQIFVSFELQQSWWTACGNKETGNENIHNESIRRSALSMGFSISNFQILLVITFTILHH